MKTHLHENIGTRFHSFAISSMMWFLARINRKITIYGQAVDHSSRHRHARLSKFYISEFIRREILLELLEVLLLLYSNAVVLCPLKADYFRLPKHWLYNLFHSLVFLGWTLNIYKRLVQTSFYFYVFLCPNLRCLYKILLISLTDFQLLYNPGLKKILSVW